MKRIRRITICLIIIVLALVAFVKPAQVFAADEEYKNEGATYKVTEVVDTLDLGNGVQYHRDIAASRKVGGTFNPQQVNVLEITPNESVQLVPFASLSGSKWNATAVKKAALKYETTHPGFKIIAGVNGDYFRINDSVRASTGVTISQGEYLKTYDDHQTYGRPVNMIAIKNSGSGKQLFTSNETKQSPFLTIYDQYGKILKEIEIDKVNDEPEANEIAVYYAQRQSIFGATLITEKADNVWFVNNAEYAVTSRKDSFYGVGAITSFTAGQTDVVEGQFAIKSNNQEITDMLAVGVKIRVQYEFTVPSLQGIDNFIGFPFTILENGVINNKDHERHPRTMIGQKENGEIVLAVIDGRQESKGMYGANSYEMAALMAYYGCIDAWNLDGGGSSTLIIRKQNNWVFNNENNGFNDDDSPWYITNNPSDGNERNDGNQLFVVVKVPEVKIDLASVDDSSITLNVALLSELDKYSNLYILLGKDYYPVQDGLVEIAGLNRDKEYTFYLYSKVGDNYINLLTTETYRTSKPKPTKVDLEVSLYKRNGEQVLFRYLIDNNQAVRSIVFVGANGDEYSTTAQTIMLEKSIDIYNIIKDGKIKVKYVCNPTVSNEEEVLVVESFDVKFDLMFLVDEMLFTSNITFENLFK